MHWSCVYSFTLPSRGEGRPPSWTQAQPLGPALVSASPSANRNPVWSAPCSLHEADIMPALWTVEETQYMKSAPTYLDGAPACHRLCWQALIVMGEQSWGAVSIIHSPASKYRPCCCLTCPDRTVILLLNRPAFQTFPSLILSVWWSVYRAGTTNQWQLTFAFLNKKHQWMDLFTTHR